MPGIAAWSGIGVTGKSGVIAYGPAWSGHQESSQQIRWAGEFPGPFLGTEGINRSLVGCLVDFPLGGVAGILQLVTGFASLLAHPILGLFRFLTHLGANLFRLLGRSISRFFGLLGDLLTGFLCFLSVGFGHRRLPV